MKTVYVQCAMVIYTLSQLELQFILDYHHQPLPAILIIDVYPWPWVWVIIQLLSFPYPWAWVIILHLPSFQYPWPWVWVIIIRLPSFPDCELEQLSRMFPSEIQKHTLSVVFSKCDKHAYVGLILYNLRYFICFVFDRR